MQLAERVDGSRGESIIPASHLLFQGYGEGFIKNVFSGTLKVHCSAIIGDIVERIQCVIIYFAHVLGFEFVLLL